MKIFSLPALILTTMLAFGHGAHAQTPRDIQNLIAHGQSAQAVSELNAVLNANPTSAVAWYLLAEAQDAQGDESGAIGSLSKAKSFNPSMSFANPQDLAALQAHLNAAPAQGRSGGGFHTAALVIGGLAVLFVLLRLFARRRGYGPAPFQQPGYGPAPFSQPGYGPGYPPQGGGLGSSLISGLAAGAGFAAGERIIEDLTGGNRANAGQVFQTPDDGLQGNPGWGDQSGSPDNGLNDNSWS
jgi:hypothetical protein